MSLDVGTRLGVYEVLAAIGAGGMGEVYRARDTKLGRAVAVKVLPEAFAFDADRVARFQREATVLASLNHPHIATLYGMEEAAGRHFLVMELVEGETLGERIERAQGSRLTAQGPDTVQRDSVTGPKPEAGSPRPAQALGSESGSLLQTTAPSLGEARQRAGVGSPRGLEIDEALAIAHQIADALEAAHEKGIVHRDLKPANVKITPDEQVKVLDFGLAKAMENAPAAASLTQSPTLSMAATQAGVILGTAAYMSPEQAKGLAADHRSDLFSFGVVLYEMLTGRQPFQGDTVPDVLASVLARDPDLSALPQNLNPRLPELIRRCLEKNPKRRWQAVGDLRAEIEMVAAAPRVVAAPAVTQAVVQSRPLWRRAAPVLVAAIVAGTLVGAAMWSLRPAAPPLAITRFLFTLPQGQQFFTNTAAQLVAISPDGTQMAYVVNQRVYLRSMSELEARPIPGTEIPQGVGNSVFSPDGRSIVFYSYADGTLKRIAVSGGAAVTMCQADAPFGMSWDKDGIVFGQGRKGIMRVSANGGRPELLVSVKGEEVAHGPQMLPGGEAVLFTLATGAATEIWNKGKIIVQSLRSGERKTLIEGGTDARYLPTGHIVYALGGVLFAVPFDLKRLEVTGGPVPIVEGVRRANTTGTAQFSFSDAGSLIYIPGAASTSSAQLDLAWLDRKGSLEPLKLQQTSYEFPRISPEGKRVAFGTNDGKEEIVWIYDLSGASSMRRLTFGGKNRFPIWSADGERVAFQSDREGDLGIFWQRADGTGTAERLTKPDQGTSHIPESWSPDGKRLSFSLIKDSNASLWLFSLSEGKAAPFGEVRSPSLFNSMFSPDGQWLAYQSSETGTMEVYVQPFPITGAKYQISKNGGYSALWSPDQRELFYVPAAGQLAVVGVTTRPSFTVSNLTPVPRGGLQQNGAPFRRNFDIAPNEKRIIGVVAAGQSQSGAPAAPQIQVVLNWFEELKARVPVP